MASNAENAENPAVKWFKEWVSRTPYISRSLLIFLAFLQIGELLLGTNVAEKIANIPFYTVFRFQIYRLILSPLALGGILDFVFTCIVFSSFGPRLENALGSTAFLCMMGTLALGTNIIFVLLMIILAMNPILPQLHLLGAPCSGSWLIIYGILVHDCLKSPGTTRRLWLLPINVPSEYYPWGILILFSILFGLQISSFVAVGVGYLYGYGFFNFLIPSSNRIQQWEEGCLRKLVTNQGYIDASTCQGFQVYLPTVVTRNEGTSSSSSTSSSSNNSRNTWGTIVQGFNSSSSSNGTSSKESKLNRSSQGEQKLGTADTNVKSITSVDRKKIREVAAAAAEARIPPPAAGIVGMSVKAINDPKEKEEKV